MRDVHRVARLPDGSALQILTGVDLDVVAGEHVAVVGRSVTITLLIAFNPPASAMLTVNTYVPAAEKVAVEAFAALVPLAENVGSAAPLGLLVTAHVYVRFASPRLYPPSTDSAVVLPLRGFGVAFAAVTTVGF